MLARYRGVAYFTGATAARVGDEMSAPTLLLVSLAVLGSARDASLVFGGLTIAAAVGGPVFGVILDRTPQPGRVLGVALVGYAGGLAVVGALLGHVGMAYVIATAGITGLLAPALSAGWTAQLADVLPAGRLARGHAMDAGTYNLAALVGPALAAVLAITWSPGWALAAAIGVLLLAAPFAWKLPPPGRAQPVRTFAVRAVSIELRAGLHAIWQIVPLRRITAASTVAYVGVGMFVVACPLLGRAHFGSASRGALLLSVLAAAALMATAALARWPVRCRPETTFVSATALSGAALVLLGMSSTTIAILGAVILLGIADGPQLTALFAVRHRDAPPHLRSQIFTTGASLKISAAALGAVLAGALSTRTVTVVLIAAAATQFAALLTYVVTGSRAAAHPPSEGYVSARKPLP